MCLQQAPIYCWKVSCKIVLSKFKCTKKFLLETKPKILVKILCICSVRGQSEEAIGTTMTPKKDSQRYINKRLRLLDSIEDDCFCSFWIKFPKQNLV